MRFLELGAIQSRTAGGGGTDVLGAPEKAQGEGTTYHNPVDAARSLLTHLLTLKLRNGNYHNSTPPLPLISNLPPIQYIRIYYNGEKLRPLAHTKGCSTNTKLAKCHRDARATTPEHWRPQPQPQTPQRLPLNPKP